MGLSKHGPVMTYDIVISCDCGWLSDVVAESQRQADDIYEEHLSDTEGIHR